MCDLFNKVDFWLCVVVDCCYWFIEYLRWKFLFIYWRSFYCEKSVFSNYIFSNFLIIEGLLVLKLFFELN